MSGCLKLQFSICLFAVRELLAELVQNMTRSTVRMAFNTSRHFSYYVSAPLYYFGWLVIDEFLVLSKKLEISPCKSRALHLDIRVRVHEFR